MFIYQSTRVMPYVYMCIERDTNNFYIGYRFSNTTPSSTDFGQHYFTSNQYVKNNFSKFDHYIVAEFYTKQDAYAFESLLIKETKCNAQINSFRNKTRVAYKNIIKQPYVPEIKICPLPECQQQHTNWRMKCCCTSHQKRYAATRSHA